VAVSFFGDEVEASPPGSACRRTAGAFEEVTSSLTALCHAAPNAWNGHRAIKQELKERLEISSCTRKIGGAHGWSSALVYRDDA